MGSLASIWGLVSRVIKETLGSVQREAPAEEDAPFRWVECAELSAQLRHGGAVVIDVRGPQEFSGPIGHIPGAANLPLQALQGRLAALPPVSDKPVVLVCHTDRRSAAAASHFRAAGFRDVGVLRGGMVRWRAEGLPVEETVAS